MERRACDPRKRNLPEPRDGRKSKEKVDHGPARLLNPRDEIERLYGLPLDEFVTQSAALAKRREAKGDARLAAVKAAQAHRRSLGSQPSRTPAPRGYPGAARGR